MKKSYRLVSSIDRAHGFHSPDCRFDSHGWRNYSQPCFGDKAIHFGNSYGHSKRTYIHSAYGILHHIGRAAKSRQISTETTAMNRRHPHSPFRSCHMANICQVMYTHARHFSNISIFIQSAAMPPHAAACSRLSTNVKMTRTYECCSY